MSHTLGGGLTRAKLEEVPPSLSRRRTLGGGGQGHEDVGMGAGSRLVRKGKVG